MKPGDEVRLRYNPTRRGVLRKSKTRPNGRHWFVALGNDRPGYVPESQLELVPDGPLTPMDLLETGEYGAPADFRRLLTHLRVSGHSADMLYSMAATNTDFNAYQFKPVIKILESPTGRVLLADEVGLGKTIEAGLIWTELRSRLATGRLLVLCPKQLREKWHRELSNRFGIDATITDASGLLRRLESGSRLSEFQVICSFSSLIRRKTPEGSTPSKTHPAHSLAEYLEKPENDRCIDLLVVDEAHAGRNPDTGTHNLIATAVSAARFSAFLSATPIHNKQRDLLSLLSLLDPDTFPNAEVLQDIQRANAPLIRARDAVRSASMTATDIDAHLGVASRHPMLSGSEQLKSIRRDVADLGENPMTAEKRARLVQRIERVNLLGHVICRTRRRDVELNRAVRDPFPQSVKMKDLERAYYGFVTAGVRDFAEHNEIAHAFLLAQPQRLMASCFAASLSTWFSDLDEESGNGSGPHPAKPEGPLISHLRNFVRESIVRQGSSVADIGKRLREQDSKYRLLSTRLQEYLAAEAGTKLVLFSAFRGTIKYLARRLEEDGMEVAVLHGGQDVSVDEVIAKFREKDGPSILLSTEIGAEGVDLQFCSLLVNYDVPWNPMRIEQRIGRLDRIGQKAERIVIWTFLHEDTIDFRIYELLLEKVGVFRQYLGDCEEVVSEEMRELTLELVSAKLTDEQMARRIEETANAIENRRRQERELEAEAPALTAYGDYILDRVLYARDMGRWLDPQDIDAYVTENLRRLYPGTRVTRPGAEGGAPRPGNGGRHVVDLDLAPRAQEGLRQFIRRKKISAGTRLANALGPVRCRFTNRVDEARVAHEEIVDQFHPITRFVVDLLDGPDHAEVQGAAVAAQLSRSKMIGSGWALTEGVYVLVVASRAFVGDRQTTHVGYAGRRLAPTPEMLRPEEAERLAGAVLTSGRPWIGARGRVERDRVRESAGDLFQELAERFEAVEGEERARNEDRIDVHVAAIDRRVERRTAVLTAVAQGHRERAGEHRLRGEETKAARRESLARTAETTLRGEMLRLDRRKAEVAARRVVQYDPQREIAAAVILIGEPDEA